MTEVAQAGTLPLRVALFVGTRPEAIKLAPVVRLLRRDERFEPLFIGTGQHGHLLDEMLVALELSLDHRLSVDRSQPGLNELLGQLLTQTDELLSRIEPHMVMVQGDTSSAFGVGLAAFQRGLKVAHLEAGLRSYDRFHPFPEESNRRMLSAVSDLHLCPTATSKAQLLREGVPAADVAVIGNTAVDALFEELARQSQDGSSPWHEPDVVLVTLHRRESWVSRAAGGTALEAMLGALAVAARRYPEFEFVFPVHPNPRVQQPARQQLGGLENVRLLEPQPFPEFVRWMSRARVILTDSGGIQEEAPSLGVPVLVLRRTTERPEALEGGESRLVGTDPVDLLDALEEVLLDPPPNPRQRPYANPFGDGRASERARDALLFLCGQGPAPTEFASSRALSTAELPRL